MKNLRLLLCAIAGAIIALPAAAVAAPDNAASLRVVERIPGPDGGWDYASLDAPRHRVYISHSDVVLALDLDTGKLNAQFAKGDHLHAIVPVPGSPNLVTTNSGDSTVRIIRASDGELVKSLKVAADADGAVYDPATKLVVVVNGEPGQLTLIDVAHLKVAGVINVGGALEFAAVDGRGRAYVNVESTGEVAVVDLIQRKAVGRYAMKDCKRPTGIAYVAGDRLVSACGSGGSKILDAKTGREIASFDTGGFPDAVIYDPVRHLAMVPTAIDGKLNVIALSGKADNTIIAQVPTQIGARLGAVDPSTGRIYLPTAEYNLPVPAGQRPTTKPGTFQILVLDR
jgi:DNA-binding beta-propeller fold protein YncE